MRLIVVDGILPMLVELKTVVSYLNYYAYVSILIICTCYINIILILY